MVCKKGHKNIVVLLWNQPSIDHYSSDIYFSFLDAAAYKHLDVVEFLLSQQIDVNVRDKTGYTSLHYACFQGNIEMAEFLLKQTNIDVNISDDYFKYTPLHNASKQGHPQIVELLLKNPSINVNSKDERGKTPLHHAIERLHLDIAITLSNHPQIDINAQDDIMQDYEWLFRILKRN